MLPLQKKVQLSDQFHPSIEDYKRLQYYLKYADRPELDLLCVAQVYVRKKRMRDFNLITDQSNPVFQTLYLNDSPLNKKKCVVTYISFNRNYEQGLNALIETLKVQKFDGHIIYRIGGWPNTEEGCLELFDVPYAFKICALLEAKRMGYEQCLWLDASIQPLKSIDPIFELIAKNGLCFFSWSHPQAHLNVCSEFTVGKLGLTLEEFHCLKPISVTILGFDFTQEKALGLLNKWHAIAKKRMGFLSVAPEEAPFSVLVNQSNLLSCEGDPKFFQSDKSRITQDTIFFLDWPSVR
ncbi:MAG: hypothetical protein P4L16_00550 [Chlamydiales bacterium]|nr:hypothetical protein [Chlamydiales bacterium]